MTQAVDALQEPTRRVGRGYLTIIALANLGTMIAFFTPIQNLLPRLAEQVSGGMSKETALAWITGAGAFVSVVANPLAGALSDRTTSRLGRRRPWVLGGAVLGLVSIALLPTQGTVLGAGAAVGGQPGHGERLLRGDHGVHPRPGPGEPARDRLGSGRARADPRRRGRGGDRVVRRHRPGCGLAWSPACCSCCSRCRSCCGCATRCCRRSGGRRSCSGSSCAGSGSARGEYPDFGWAWLTRFLISLSNAMATLYLLFFLKDKVGYANPEQGQTVLIAAVRAGHDPHGGDRRPDVRRQRTAQGVRDRVVRWSWRSLG